MEPNRRPTSVFTLAIILILASSVCIGSILVVADIQCNSDIEAWLPLYPDAETVSVDYDGFRPRGLGNTQWIQQSSDEPETIRQFYRDTTIDLMRSERSRGLASTDWHVELDEKTGESRIFLISSCGT